MEKKTHPYKIYLILSISLKKKKEKILLNFIYYMSTSLYTPPKPRYKRILIQQIYIIYFKIDKTSCLKIYDYFKIH